jgi:hypothetical protein
MDGYAVTQAQSNPTQNRFLLFERSNAPGQVAETAAHHGNVQNRRRPDHIDWTL